MLYEIHATLKFNSSDRMAVLQKIVLMQRYAVSKMGFDPANVAITQVTESTEDPVVDITSLVMEAILTPQQVNPPPPPPDPVP